MNDASKDVFPWSKVLTTGLDELVKNVLTSHHNVTLVGVHWMGPTEDLLHPVVGFISKVPQGTTYVIEYTAVHVGESENLNRFTYAFGTAVVE